MEMGIDLIGALRARLDRVPGTRSDAPAAAHPDWDGLRARLQAGYAARRAVLAAGGAARRGGSFDGKAADTLNAPVYASRAVNLTDLMDGKVPARKAADVAVPSTTGDRG